MRYAENFIFSALSWFLDFESYQLSAGHFIVKEIAILSDDGSRCYNYFVRGPLLQHVSTDNTLYFQFRRHNLRWDWGDYSFDEALGDIYHKVRGCTVYVKGEEKAKFMGQELPNVVEIDWLPPFKQLNNCNAEVCDV